MMVTSHINVIPRPSNLDINRNKNIVNLNIKNRFRHSISIHALNNNYVGDTEFIIKKQIKTMPKINKDEMTCV